MPPMIVMMVPVVLPICGMLGYDVIVPVGREMVAAAVVDLARSDPLVLNRTPVSRNTITTAGNP